MQAVNNGQNLRWHQSKRNLLLCIFNVYYINDSNSVYTSFSLTLFDIRLKDARESKWGEQSIVPIYYNILSHYIWKGKSPVNKGNFGFCPYDFFLFYDFLSIIWSMSQPPVNITCGSWLWTCGVSSYGQSDGWTMVAWSWSWCCFLANGGAIGS